jgi:hypothetical protein
LLLKKRVKANIYNVKLLVYQEFYSNVTKTWAFIIEILDKTPQYWELVKVNMICGNNGLLSGH